MIIVSHWHLWREIGLHEFYRRRDNYRRPCDPRPLAKPIKPLGRTRRVMARFRARAAFKRQMGW